MRQSPDVRKQDILEAAARCANSKNYAQLTQSEIAREANISPGTIHYHFTDLQKFKEKLMEWAVETQQLTIIGQGLAIGDPIAKEAPESVRAAAAAQLGV